VGSHATRPVLVAYASKQGSTREVAEFIGGVLADNGCRAAIRNAADVHDLEPYRGVVLGGSIYIGRWHPDAIEFLQLHADALAGLPLAIFALGPRSLAEAEVATSRAQLDSSLAKVPDATPAAVAIFGGVVDPTKLRCPFNRLPPSDARDWVAIRAWADEAAQLFARQALSV
jgi:menaquinone-dependent protoporphyrinogen oxidase